MTRDENLAAFGRIADGLRSIIDGQAPANHLPAVMRDAFALAIDERIVGKHTGAACELLEPLRLLNDALSAGVEHQKEWWRDLEKKARGASKPSTAGTVQIKGF